MSHQKVVKVFTTTTCPYCKKLKNYLHEKRIVFEEYDVREDQIAREEMIRKTGQMGVPVTLIDDEIVIGYDVGLLQKKLDKY